VQEHNSDNIDMEAVYQDYADFIYRFLYSHTHDAQWSQELTQETFLRKKSRLKMEELFYGGRRN